MSITSCFVNEVGDWIHKPYCGLICYRNCGWCSAFIKSENDYTYRCPEHTKENKK